MAANGGAAAGRWWRAGTLAIAACLAGALPPAAAQPAAADAAQRMREAEDALARERAARAEAQRASRAALEAQRRAESERIAAFAALRRAEAEAEAAARRLAEAEAAHATAAAALSAETDRLAPVLPVIQRLALFPAETLLVEPGPPAERLAAHAALRALAARLAAEAQALVRAAARGEAARAERAREAEALRAALAVARERAAALDQAAQAARTARSEAEAAEAAQARRLAEAAAGAASLRALVERLDARIPAATPSPRGPGVARGSLTWPVRGPLVPPAGEDGEADAPRLRISAMPGARVLAPCSGSIAFAAPFRSLGPLLILDCGDGYHVVLAGFQNLDGVAGQAVRAGDPVGAMPVPDPRSGRRAVLSMELRRAGRALDPAPFLTRQQDRIGG